MLRQQSPTVAFPSTVQLASSGKIRLVEGQSVGVDPTSFPRIQLPQPDPDVEFSVIYEDESIIVVDKPAGLVVHPGAGNMEGTLANGLLARFPEIVDVGESNRPGIVHRLDSGSSGLLVVARTQVSCRLPHCAVRRSHMHAPLRSARVGCARRTARDHRCAVGPQPLRPLKMASRDAWQVRAHRLPSHWHVPRACRSFSCRLSPGNRTHTPDSCAPLVDQPSARR